MRALVAGGSGFVGAAVAGALERAGFDVVALSRSGRAPTGRGVAGDVRLPGLGLGRSTLDDLRPSVTHVVGCFGSVDWDAGPRDARDLHEAGTRNLMAFAADCPRLERAVHLSSVLALGRAEGVVAGDELELGQSFRTWYEYGKFLAERTVRESWPFPRRVVRTGAVLGVGAAGAPTTRDAITAALPALLRGYPLHLQDGGSFPAYACEVGTLGAVLARACVDDGPDEGVDTWTWFDDRLYTVAQVFTGLCAAWGVQPRLVDLPPLGALSWLGARRMGIPEAILHYARPWVAIPASVLERLPDDLPRCPGGYLEATGEALRAHAADAMAA